MEIKELRELFGISHSSIYYILAQQGFPQNRAVYRRGKIPFATRQQIIQEYKDGALVTDLSNKYNVTIQSIYHHLDRQGLRLKKEKLPPRPIESRPTEITPPLLLRDAPPTSDDRLEFGTRILDLPNRQLYVQMNHDKNIPRWICLNQPQQEKKGIFSFMKRWFSKT